jgi:hypothetical protein
VSVEQSQIEPQVNRLLESAVGMTLVHSQLLKEGFRFVYENAAHRIVILLTPKVYTDGAVIVDAINDLVIVASMTRYDLETFRRDGTLAAPIGQETFELPYSTWFFPGNYR